MKTVVKKVRGYTILEEGGIFWGIKDEYIKNGIITKRLNGIQGNASRTLDGCERLCDNAFKVDKLVEDGIDRAVAIVMVTMGMEESKATELAQKLK